MIPFKVYTSNGEIFLIVKSGFPDDKLLCLSISFFEKIKLNAFTIAVNNVVFPTPLRPIRTVLSSPNFAIEYVLKQRKLLIVSSFSSIVR